MDAVNNFSSTVRSLHSRADKRPGDSNAQSEPTLRQVGWLHFPCSDVLRGVPNVRAVYSARLNSKQHTARASRARGAVARLSENTKFAVPDFDVKKQNSAWHYTLRTSLVQSRRVIWPWLLPPSQKPPLRSYTIMLGLRASEITSLSSVKRM